MADNELLCRELFAAHGKIRSAAMQIANASERPELGKLAKDLEKLAGEVMTMASVTEIVAYSVRDEPSNKSTGRLIQSLPEGESKA